MTNNYAERLVRLAQRLDELAGEEEGPSELTDISEELGRIADAWPEKNLNENPRWLAQLKSLVEGIAPEVLAERYGGPGMTSSNQSHFTLSFPNPSYFDPRLTAFNAKDAAKIMGGVV